MTQLSTNEIAATNTAKRSALDALIVLIISFTLGAFFSTLEWHFDMQIACSAALRVISGQVIYRDFAEPHGPVSDWVLAVFMLLTPTIGWAVVMASGMLNALVAWLTWRMVLLATPRRDTAFQAALISSFWYTGIFGSYYHDHLAYAFIFAGYLVFLSWRKHWTREILVALFFVLAFQTKQTVGVTGLAALTAILLLYMRGRALRDAANYRIVLYFLLFQIVFFAILFLKADPQKYWIYSIQNPMSYSPHDPDKDPRNLIGTLLYPYKSYIQLSKTGMAWSIIIMLVYWTYYRWYQRWRAEKQLADGSTNYTPSFIHGLMLLSSLWCSSLLGRDRPEIAFGLGAVLALAWDQLPKHSVRILLTGLCCASSLVVLYNIHDLKYGVDPYFNQTDLTPIKVRYSRDKFDAKGTEATVRYMQDKPGKMAVVSEGASLVPLALRRAPYAPTSYLQNGLGVPLPPVWRDAWQREFIRILDQEPVDYILSVLPYNSTDQAESNVEPSYCRSDLPILGAHIARNYREVFRQGHFCVLKRLAADKSETQTNINATRPSGGHQ